MWWDMGVKWVPWVACEIRLETLNQNLKQVSEHE